MATDRLRIIVDELQTTIKQTFDDKQVTKAQVAYLVILAANKLLGQHIAKRDSGQFLNIFGAVPVKVATDTIHPDLIKGRKYIELPGSIFDYDKDEGVEYIAYQDDELICPPSMAVKTFQRTSPSQAQWLYLNKYTTPSPKQPYWYRVNNLIYILGLEKVPVKNLEIGIYLTIDPLEEIDLDAPFRFPQELMEVLKRQVLDLARFSFLFDSRADRSNDGNDSAEAANIPKIASVNQQQQEQ